MYSLKQLVTLVLFVVINGKENWFIFSHDKKVLFICIQDRLVNTNPYYEEVGIAKIISVLAADRFSGRTQSEKTLKESVYSFFYTLRHERSYLFSSNQVLSTKLMSDLRKALKTCVIESTEASALPFFQNEPMEIAAVLDYILVNWPNYPYHMIQSREGRSLLRSYAYNAQNVLENALRFFSDNSIFRLSLRVFWMRRAEELFANNDIYPLYIDHRYTINDTYPHTNGDISAVHYLRRAQNFQDRNPPAPRSLINNILNIHSVDRLECLDRFDIFLDYAQNGMSLAEHYLEDHINQFYRLLFFFIELQARNITDEDEIDEALQDILIDDNCYRDYLLTRRNNELINGDYNNFFIQILALTAIVREEDLVSLWMNTPSTSGVQFRATTVSGTTSTTTVRSTSTTLGYKPTKRKGNIEYTNDLTKRQKTSVHNCCQDINKNPDSKNSNNHHTNLCHGERYNLNVTTSKDKIVALYSEMKSQRLRLNIRTIDTNNILDADLRPHLSMRFSFEESSIFVNNLYFSIN